MTGTQSLNISRSPHEQKTKVRPVSVVFTEEESQNGQTTESRHLQDESCGRETRTSRSIFQAALTRKKTLRSIGQTTGTAGPSRIGLFRNRKPIETDTGGGLSIGITDRFQRARSGGQRNEDSL